MSEIDLHIHSEYSDGSDGLSEIVDKIVKSGITCFSVTDHDETEGATKMFSLLPKGVFYINGVEFSCILNGFKCHVLGYGYDANDGKIKSLVERGKKIRREKLTERLAFLKERYQIEFSEKEVEYLYGLNSAGKPHLSNLLIKRGLCGDIQEGINKYLSAFPKMNDRLSADEVISAILSSGGIPVWAHPLGGEGERRLGEEEFAVALKDLIDSGIKGLECYYSRYGLKEVEFLKNQAEKFGLMISGGSDYHGSNKTVNLGQLNCENADISVSEVNIVKEFKK